MKRFRRVTGIGVFLMLALFSACAGTLPRERVIALVDDTTITEADLQHALSDSHKGQDKKSEAESFDIMRYVDKLVDERLMVDEAKRMGLDSDPNFEKKIRAHILTQAVMRLHEEEVLSRVVVSEEDMKKTFVSSYVSLGLIELASKEEAEQVKEELIKGADFGEIAEKKSSHGSKARGGAVVYKRTALTPLLVELVAGLVGQQLSEPTEISGKWYLFRLETRAEVLQKNFDLVKEAVRKELKPKLQKEREEEVLERFRQKNPVSIDQQVFDSLDLEAIAANPDDWSSDVRVLARVKDSGITVADFVNASQAKPQKNGNDKSRSRDDILKGLINIKLIDVEALSRGYELEPELAEQLRYVTESGLRQLFYSTVIFPSIDLSEEEMLAFYRTNQELFKTEPLYRFQRIRLKTEVDARRTLSNLKGGADFLWVARNKLAPDQNEEDINTGWQTKKDLPEGLRQIADDLKQGDVSPVVTVDNLFGIYRLTEKKAAAVKPYEEVKESVRKQLFESQKDRLMAEAMRELRSQSKIVIYKDVLEKFKKRWMP